MALPPAASPADRSSQHVTEVSQGTGADPTLAFPAPQLPASGPDAPDPDAARASYYSRSPLAALDARSITAWFGDRMVLEDVSLTMEAGEVTALIGPSGC